MVLVKTKKLPTGNKFTHQNFNQSGGYESYGEKADLRCSVALDEAINIVEEHSDWVRVDERLPNDGDIVEVYRDSYKWGDLIWQCLYTESKGFRNYPVDGIGKNEKITHWKQIHPPKL